MRVKEIEVKQGKTMVSYYLEDQRKANEIKTVEVSHRYQEAASEAGKVLLKAMGIKEEGFE